MIKKTTPSKLQVDDSQRYLSCRKGAYSCCKVPFSRSFFSVKFARKYTFHDLLILHEMSRIRRFSENVKYGNCCAPILYQKTLMKNTFFDSFPLEKTLKRCISCKNLITEECTHSVIRLMFLGNDFDCI